MKIEDSLALQRKSIPFSPMHLTHFLYGKTIAPTLSFLENAPTMPFDPNIYNKNRLSLILDAYKKLPVVQGVSQGNLSFDSEDFVTYLVLGSQHQLPGSAHVGMFLKFIELMGSQEQKKMYIQKCKTYEIVGCYAQTEMGHGSDVQSLQTTATYNPSNQTFTLHSPTISSAKYWPGEIAFIANYALVFAQMIIKGKKLGVFPFLAQIKNENGEWLAGVEGGDIGPKIGFHAKQNGYLMFRNVSIPKSSLVSKFVSLSNEGELTLTGDPRLAYGTMMHIRQLISCSFPKIYSQVITIAVRYSIFRRQFKNQYKEQIKIIDYPTQMDKLIPRIAEYYAICVAGNKIKQGSHRNTQNLLQREDMSMLQQTHSNLSFSKCLFSEIVLDGMQVCRRACGGHGFSHYSGIPHIISEYYAHVTHQGQNTVMYLQTAKYIMKNYRRYKQGKGVTGQSVLYVESVDSMKENSCRFKRSNQSWDAQEMRVAIVQGLGYLIELIAEKQSLTTQEDMLSCRLVQLAKLHGYYYIYTAFQQAIIACKNQSIRQYLSSLLLLFGITALFSVPSPVIQAGILTPNDFTSLLELRGRLFQQLRPVMIGLVDGFGFPQKYIRSEIISGDPYENFLKRARECEINQKTSESAFIVRQNLKRVISAHTNRIQAKL